MILIITQKTSVASYLAALVNANQKHWGHYMGKEYMVCSIQEIYFYRNNTPRSNGSISILKSDTLVLKKIKLIKSLTRKSKQLLFISEPHPSKEVQLRYLYEYLNLSLPFKTMWINSFYRPTLLEHLAKIHQDVQEKKDNLYNGFMAKESIYKELSSLITPEKSIVKENRNDFLAVFNKAIIHCIVKCVKRYKKQPLKTYQLKLEVKENNKTRCLYLDKTFDNKQNALLYKEYFSCQSRLSFSFLPSSLKPKKALDMITLALKAYRYYGIDFSKTFELALELYYQGFVSYPLTLNRSLSCDIKDTIAKRLHVLLDYPNLRQQILEFKKSSYLFKSPSLKYKSYPILTTYKLPSVLSSDKKAIYDLIVKGFVKGCSLSQSKQSYTLKSNINGQTELLKFKNSKSVNSYNTQVDVSFKAKLVSCQIIELPYIEKEVTLKRLINKVKRDFLKCLEVEKIKKDELCFFIDFFEKLLLSLEYLIKSKQVVYKKDSLSLSAIEGNRFNKQNSIKFTMLYQLELYGYKLQKEVLSLKDFTNKTTKLLEEFKQVLKYCKAQNNSDLLCPLCLKNKVIIDLKHVFCSFNKCSWSIKRNIFGQCFSINQISDLLTKGSLIKPVIVNYHKTGKLKLVASLDKDKRLMIDFAKM
ncbi:DNA topoisomerase [Myroides injenensis]|uniref:DNA topoisomerase n=1 Tax=Myroides injenensis TaxID=1183151 RepID=UPI000288A2DB|nr:DNA topoisomerase [Myroides injenensis]